MIARRAFLSAFGGAFLMPLAKKKPVDTGAPLLDKIIEAAAELDRMKCPQAQYMIIDRFTFYESQIDERAC